MFQSATNQENRNYSKIIQTEHLVQDIAYIGDRRAKKLNMEW